MSNTANLSKEVLFRLKQDTSYKYWTRPNQIVMEQFLAQELKATEERVKEEERSRINTAFESICQDDEVHCYYSCHVCGGVGDFIGKLKKQLKGTLKINRY